MSDIHTVVFYTIEKAIKSYRQFAQRQLVAIGSSITVDHWLILNVINDHPGILQGKIAELVFKDKASIARMIDLLVNADHVERSIPVHDRRTVHLKLTRKGLRQLTDLQPVVKNYRKQALQGISAAETKALESTLQKLIRNCHE